MIFETLHESSQRGGLLDSGSSTPLADFVRLVALLEETSIAEILQDELEFGSDDWLFVYRLFDKDNRE